MQLRVLLVEDDEIFIKNFKNEIAEIEGLILVGHCSTQSDGLLMITKYQPDILVVDMMLEEGSGPVLLRDIVQENVLRPTHIVAITSSTNKELHTYLKDVSDFIIVKDQFFQTSKLTAYLETLFFSKLKQSLRQNQAAKSFANHYLNRFILDNIQQNKLDFIEMMIYESLLNNLSKETLPFSKLRTHLKEKYSKYSFHQSSSIRIIETLVTNTPLSTLENISSDFVINKFIQNKKSKVRVNVTEKLFFEIAFALFKNE